MTPFFFFFYWAFGDDEQMYNSVQGPLNAQGI